MDSLHHFLLKLGAEAGAAAATDADLLDQFHRRGSDAAFAALVRRHGPLVYDVCRRMLPHPQDAEDAFQATFLVLAAKGGALARPAALGPWLYGVAHCTARRARRGLARRRAHEQPWDPRALPEVPVDAAGPDPDLRPLLDEELAGLPEKYRAPLVLCYLLGQTKAEAALHLGWPEGTVAGWMARGKALLGARLRRRGLAPAVAGLATALDGLQGATTVPPEVLANAVALGQALRSGRPLVSTVAVRLMKGVEAEMWWRQLQPFALLAAGCLVIAGPFGLAALQPPPAAEPSTPGAQPPPPPPPTLTGIQPARSPDRKPFQYAATHQELRALLDTPSDRLKTGLDKGTGFKDALDYIARVHGFIYRTDLREMTDASRPELGGALDETLEHGELEVPPLPRLRLSTLLGEVLRRVKPPCTYLVKGHEVVVVLATYPQSPDGLRPAPLLCEPLTDTRINGRLEEALTFLEESTGASLILDPQHKDQGQKEVAARFQRTRLETAVQILAAQVGLQAVALDNVLYVTTPERVAALERVQRAAWERDRLGRSLSPQPLTGKGGGK
jgi:RNA polymerase sigma factor (sigma-70 family)